MYGKPSLLRSSPQTRLSRSRARGPQSPIQHWDDEMSLMAAEPSPGRCARIHSRSWRPIAPPVTTMKRSSAKRVTVRSHLIPPLGVSIEVYVMEPTRLSIWLEARRWRAASESGPEISNWANGVRSNMATRCLVATCSAATVGDHSLAPSRLEIRLSHPASPAVRRWSRTTVVAPSPRSRRRPRRVPFVLRRMVSV